MICLVKPPVIWFNHSLRIVVSSMAGWNVPVFSLYLPSMKNEAASL